MNTDHIVDILHKHVSGNALSDAEQAQLDEWLNASPENRRVLKEAEGLSGLEKYLLRMLNNISVEKAWKLFEQNQNHEKTVAYSEPAPPAPRVPVLRWWGWAAACAVLFASGIYFLNVSDKKIKTDVAYGDYQKTDIAPGGNRAVLTLADGSKILLDSASDGELVRQGDVQVIKKNNGELMYSGNGTARTAILWNTMSTPAGGQYQLTLPDGTKVWLNAMSSITFPIAFADNERRVQITGEVYFEVTRNERKPFTVDINGRSSVEVLGTSFNINAYTNEELVTTTLIEGSVKVSAGGSQAKLRPGQQAVVSAAAAGGAAQTNTFGSEINIIAHADVAQVVAWKNGLFNFNNAGLKPFLRQLERWYDIEVQYDREPVSGIHIRGKMYRNVNLSNVLQFLEASGLRFRMEGKTLIVM